MQYLTERTQLASQNYKFIHHESKDERGVDVAMLYDTAQFSLVNVEFLNVDVPEKTTREILFATGVLSNGDTLHVFVNHWPSRYGGELVSQHRRFKAARVLRSKVDSLYRVNPMSNIIIMGDLNDYPDNESVKDTLGASAYEGKLEPNSLYNLMYKYQGSEGIGTHYFAGEWGILDHIIVSSSLLDSSTKTYCNHNDIMIFKQDFILQKNAKGVKVPNRSFKGNFFVRQGYSDHLPIYLDIQLK